jgi:3-hydroxyacyl-[acyl-carrier-protein] dehydratase
MSMRFRQIDRITEIQVGKSIVAVKDLHADETYLKDHFPRFAVMPGVLMLEAMFQAAAFLVRKSEDFAHAMVVLKEARNVKYKDFVQPGQRLVVTAKILKEDGALTTLKTEGTVDGSVAVTARLILARSNLADADPQLATMDARMLRNFREFYEEIQPQPADAI